MRGKEKDAGFEYPKHSLSTIARQLMNDLVCLFSPQDPNGHRRYPPTFDLHPSTEFHRDMYWGSAELTLSRRDFTLHHSEKIDDNLHIAEVVMPRWGP
jgi:hypothetical protein